MEVSVSFLEKRKIMVLCKGIRGSFIKCGMECWCYSKSNELQVILEYCIKLFNCCHVEENYYTNLVLTGKQVSDTKTVPETSDTKLPWVLWDICYLETEWNAMWTIIRVNKTCITPKEKFKSKHPPVGGGCGPAYCRTLARHAPPVVLLSSLRTQLPFTSVTPLIKGWGPSVS